MSKLREYLYEAVEMLLDRDESSERVTSTVQGHAVTGRIARRVARRCGGAGIEVALASAGGGEELCAPLASGTKRSG